MCIINVTKGQNVKNTMFDKALQIIAPHLCLGCGKIGSLLCSSCRYDIVSEPFNGCMVCQRPTTSGICARHRSPIDSAWISGERDDVLARVIDAFKFERCKSAYRDLSEVLLETLPIIPVDTVVTSIPTVRSHIRERGYDHALLIAKAVAKRRRLPYKPLLRRQTNAKQRGANRKERFRQAEDAFAAIDMSVPAKVLIVDDVVTTGATLHFAAKLLKEAGAEEVIVAAIAKQPLDQTGKI